MNLRSFWAVTLIIKGSSWDAYHVIWVQVALAKVYLLNLVFQDFSFLSLPKSQPFYGDCLQICFKSVLLSTYFTFAILLPSEFTHHIFGPILENQNWGLIDFSSSKIYLGIHAFMTVDWQTPGQQRLKMIKWSILWILELIIKTGPEPTHFIFTTVNTFALKPNWL